MPLARLSLRGFLAQAKQTLHNAAKNHQPVTIVIGNESADLDSLTSSILYAYLRSTTSQKLRSNPTSDIYVPITNIPATDVRLRPEFLSLLPHAGLDQSSLITLDDLPSKTTLAEKLRPQDTKWILVDHNVLQGYLGKLYGSRVGGVIDHHEDEGVVPTDIDSDEPRVIIKAGSCTSLVTTHFRGAWDALSSSSYAATDEDRERYRQWDAEIAKLALGSILIDTADLTSESKVTAHDVEAVEYLERKISNDRVSGPDGGAGVSFDRSALYAELSAAKKDLDGLDLDEILRKDYKEWRERPTALGATLGISSVARPLDYLMARASKDKHRSDDSHDESDNSINQALFLDAVRTYATKKNLAVFVIMTAFTAEEEDGDKFQRELLLCVLDETCEPLMQSFEARARDELALMSWRHGVLDLDDNESGRKEDGNVVWRRVYRQGATEASRKQVTPLLRTALRR
ncbi:MAG: hypothetical protein M1825_005911 [Sarcosagium campestre]|nr:MAG: hypothetical protein M1825_005911 [Sarcosagium campestre]